MNRLGKFLALSGAERRDCLEAAAWYLLVKARLAALRYPNAIERCGLRATPSDSAPPAPASAIEAVRAGVARATSGLPPDRGCLERAMTASLMLSRRRIDHVLTIGVERDGEGLRSHAWLRVGEVFVTGDGRGVAAFRPIVHYSKVN